MYAHKSTKHKEEKVFNDFAFMKQKQDVIKRKEILRTKTLRNEWQK